MASHPVSYGYIDVHVRPSAHPAAAVHARFVPDSGGGIDARGGTEGEALAALAAEMRRIAGQIEALVSVGSTVPEPVGNFVCDICHSRIRGPAGAECPFEHFPVGHAIAAPSTPTATGTCQVEHPHWEGTMICGNPLPCPKHGDR